LTCRAAIDNRPGERLLTKQPMAIMPQDGPLFAFAGLWENWRDRVAGEASLNQAAAPLPIGTTLPSASDCTNSAH
jgi:putative SOS response-associated peptidase YedK